MKIEFCIITVTYNSRNDLLKTIESVQSQSYVNFKHIIKDGLSTDETKKIVFSNFRNTKFLSYKDNGIYDAMNQAVKYAEYEFIIFLNAGDTFYSENTLKELAENIEKNRDYYSYSGGTIQIEPLTSKVKRIIGISNLYKHIPLAQLPHPSFVIRRSIITKLKIPFDPFLRISSDYKQQLILRKKNLWKVCYLKQIITVMPLGGKSNKNKASIIEGYKEIFIDSFKLSNIICIYIIALKLILNIYSKYYVLKFRKINL